jgi:hypothetical protein
MFLRLGEPKFGLGTKLRALAACLLIASFFGMVHDGLIFDVGPVRFFVFSIAIIAAVYVFLSNVYYDIIEG